MRYTQLLQRLCRARNLAEPVKATPDAQSLSSWQAQGPGNFCRGLGYTERAASAGRPRVTRTAGISIEPMVSTTVNATSAR